MVRKASEDKSEVFSLILGDFTSRIKKLSSKKGTVVYSLDYVKGFISSRLSYRSYPQPCGYYFLSEEFVYGRKTGKYSLSTLWLNPVYASDRLKIVDFLVSSATVSLPSSSKKPSGIT